MTQEEIKEFWRTQTIIQMKDIVTTQGKAYVNSRAVARICEQYHLQNFPKGQFIPLTEFGPIVMEADRRMKEREKFVSEKGDEIEEVVEYFRTKIGTLPEKKRTNASFVASYLALRYHGENPVIVVEGVKAAAEEGLVANAEELLAKYRLFQKFVSSVKLGGEEKEEAVVETVSMALYDGYKDGLSVHQLKGMLSIMKMDSVMIKKIECAFYDRLMPELEDYCKNVKYRGSLLRRDILKHYGNLDLEEVLDRMDAIAGEELDIKAIYAAIKPEVAYGQISEILMSLSRKNLSTEEAFQQLQDLRYQDYIVLSTISKIKEKGLVFPYQELFDAYYEKFANSGMKDVIDSYLKRASKEQLPAQEIVKKLKAFGYPDEFMARLLDQHLDLQLPFEEIYPLLGRKKNKEVIVPVEEIQPSVRKIASILPNGSGFSTVEQALEEGKRHDEIVAAEAEAEEEEKYKREPAPSRRRGTGKVHKIVNREKAITALDKKALVSLIIAAAGGISTAVLVCLFGVNPIVAAKNCVASIAAFTAGSAGLQQLLPSSKDLVSILGTVGTTIAGTIAYLRSNSKRKQLLKEEEREREVQPESEDERLMAEEQRKIGAFVSEILDEEKAKER